MIPGESHEQEWQAAVKMAGIWGVIWALVRLLIKARVFTVEELRDEVQSVAGAGHAG